MFTKREMTILCIGLAMIAQARAQLAEPMGPPPPGAPSTSIRNAPHYDYLNNNFISGRDKWPRPEANAERASGLAPEHNKEFAPNSSTPTGLHWEAGAQRPALEYKISDQGTIHFHVGRHGSTAAAAWSF